MVANVETRFRLLGEYFDSKGEKRRTEFNLSVNALLKGKDQAAVQRARETMQRLAAEKFAAAQAVVGSWYLLGEAGLGKDESRGLARLQSARPLWRGL